ncbi:MAG: DUF58 domain-containing protein [Acidimicrobiaceae bacterium]|nr:DUF58 domain-containing protein [Acidimicrobiaceae bacterium]
MTRFGVGVAIVGLGMLVGGWAASWAPIAVLGAGLVIVVAASFAYTAYRPRVAIERAVEPPRVEKGRPAIALVHVTNLSRRTLSPLVIEQRLADARLRARLPRLRREERSLRTYRLPTSRRGVYDVGPIQTLRGDRFGVCRRIQEFGEAQRIEVHPRLLRLRPLPVGVSYYLEGPSSDSSPQGSVTFHRLREYAEGDDLRMIHWPSTARLGQLVVRHTVDTAQPYTVVLIDLHPSKYSAETFEEAVDVAASAVASLSAGRAPVQLRTTAGARLGGPRQRESLSLVDHLTEVAPDETGSLEATLAHLRRDRGGTALVVVTGRLDPASLPMVAALRRQFDRIVVASLFAGGSLAPVYPGLTIVQAESADELARAWNETVVR